MAHRKSTNAADFLALRKMLLRLSKVDLIQFVSVNFTEFHRAQAINALHQNACHMENCVLAITDVDLDILPGFLIHALSYVTPKTIYFPIVFCLARPSSILFMEALLGPLPKFSPEKGFWEKYGHGMYAMSGSDVLNLTMGDQFKGWGLEDDDFFERAQKAEFRIVRLKEHNLIHRWHPKIRRVASSSYQFRSVLPLLQRPNHIPFNLSNSSWQNSI